MLYTLSQAKYDAETLNDLLAQISAQDALVLWQDGVLQAVRSAPLFANIEHLFVLQQDIQARGLHTEFTQISLAEFVDLTEQYHPHIAL